MKILFAFLAAVLLFASYVRLAPSKPTQWHRSVSEIETHSKTGYRTSINGVGFAELQALILATPHTKILAGDIEDRRVTYITRSMFWGFPDYTTVEQIDGDLAIVGRSRFGGGDFGVNRARIKGWIATLQQP